MSLSSQTTISKEEFYKHQDTRKHHKSTAVIVGDESKE